MIQRCVEGKGAIEWTRPSRRSSAADAARLRLHALACNLGGFWRAPAKPDPIKGWSLTSLEGKPIEIGANVVAAGAMRSSRRPRSPFGEIRSPTSCG